MRRLGIIGLLFAFCGSAQAVDTALYHRILVHAPVNTPVKRVITFQGDFFDIPLHRDRMFYPFPWWVKCRLAVISAAMLRRMLNRG